MKKLILAGLAAFTATALLAGPAFAWHSNVTGSADCEQTSVTVTVPNENWVEGDTTASGTISLAGQSKPWAVNGAGSDTATFPGVNGGTATVTGTFNTGEGAGGSVSIPMVADCEKEEEPTPTTVPPTTVAPPVDEPKVDEPQGSSTSKKRTVKKAAPAPVPTPEPAPQPPVAAPAPDALPFTGPYDYLYPIAGALLIGGLVLLIATRRRTA